MHKRVSCASVSDYYIWNMGVCSPVFLLKNLLANVHITPLCIKPSSLNNFIYIHGFGIFKDLIDFALSWRDLFDLQAKV